MARIIARIQEIAARFQATRLGRMNARYGAVRGAQLAGGIAYAALFSVFAALTIAFTVVMSLIGRNEELRQAVLDGVDDALPGIVDTGDGSGGMLSPDSLVLDSGLSITSVVAAVTLLLSALAVMGSLSGSIRAMFGLQTPPGNPVLAKVRDLLGFVVLAVSVLVTAVLGIAAGAAGSWVTDLLGLSSTLGAILVRALGLLVAFGVDLVVFVALIGVVGGARAPRRDLWIGAAAGALGAGIIRFLGTSLVGGASDNPVLAAGVGVVTLLLWVNLVSRLTLYVSAWIANPPSPATDPVDARELHAGETPNFVTMSVPRTLAWDFDVRTGVVTPTEAGREEREAAAEVRASEAAQLEAALAASQSEGSWVEQRLAARRARRAAREVRRDQQD
ncbi:YihY/virulence factor BrkB family protein [Serinibacter arcticus]|uniref:YihY/virulence factor BrkB family protein n=1 Tax=Serinibacter arcticus TaxID=1655435 RepID=A0A2U1ZTT9_9MICO|nr:YihY/virulence factor BrkB family protein [Serinibacter arcticus]PWD50353.1 YihY/virulence factor BrkB family protein [Serinibacter arcticus]